MVPGGWMRTTLKLAFMAGSSKQGNACLANVACIWEVASTLTHSSTHVNATEHNCYVVILLSSSNFS